MKPKLKTSPHYSKTSTSIFDTITIRGDSHTRHIARLVGDLVAPGTAVSGVCKPGAQLHNIVSLDQPTVSPATRPGLHCEVLIAGSNDVAVGAQHNLYRHLENVITARSTSAELLVATLPHRYDVQDPDDPIHEEIVRVNSFIEEMAARHNIQVLNFDSLGRKCFTRHGQHLSMRGKRLLAGMLVRSLPTERRQPVPPESAMDLSPPPPPGPFMLRYDTYAEAVTSCPTARPAVLLPPAHDVTPTHQASKTHSGNNLGHINRGPPFLGSPTLVNGQN